MARITPTPGQKILYFLLVSLGIGILYVDINTNSFQEIKHGYKSLKISSVYILKNISIEPVRRVLNLTKSKKTLLEENKNLKKALDASYLNNYLISRENSFYKDDNILNYALLDDDFKANYSLAKLKDLDPNIFKCCDKHRMYIELFSNSKEQSNLESVVFNKSGIIGQITNDGNYLEVILLTDVSHSIPIKSISDTFFCNAKGSGRANIIICSYNPLIWDEEISLTKTFYTSGLGGIFPRNIKIGNVINIFDISPNLREIEIALSANPLDDDIFGVFKN